MPKKWLIECKDSSITLHTVISGKTPPLARIIGYVRGACDIYCIGKIGERHEAILNLIANKCDELYIPQSAINMLWRTAPKSSASSDQLPLWSYHNDND